MGSNLDVAVLCDNGDTPHGTLVAHPQPRGRTTPGIVIDAGATLIFAIHDE